MEPVSTPHVWGQRVLPDPHLDESEGGKLAGTAMMERPGERLQQDSPLSTPWEGSRHGSSPGSGVGGTLSRQVLWGRDRLSQEPVRGCDPQGCLHRTKLAHREEESLLEPRDHFLNSASLIKIIFSLVLSPLIPDFTGGNKWGRRRSKENSGKTKYLSSWAREYPTHSS